MKKRLLSLLMAVGILLSMFSGNFGVAMAASDVLSHIEVIYNGKVVTSGGYLNKDDFQVNAYYRDGNKTIGRIVRVRQVENFEILEYTLTSGANTITISYTEGKTTVVGRCTVPVSESVAGWIYNKKAGGWTYRLGIDQMATEQWVFLDDKFYYFDEEGFMQTGWQMVEGEWYYLYEDGSCAINTMTPDGYRVDNRGVWIAPRWIYDKKLGGWTFRKLNNKLAASEWLYYKKKWYYLNDKNLMLTGWHELDGNWYYLNEDGSCAINTLTPDGYQVDENGVWMQEVERVEMETEVSETAETTEAETKETEEAE